MPKQKSFTRRSHRRSTAWLSALCISTLALTLMGCSSLTPLLQVSRPALPASLLTSCPLLSPLSDGSGAAVLRKLVEVSEQYHDCRRRHDALAEAVK